MNISPVSFGKKIPITQCKIRDNSQGKFIPATFYEVDCKDMEDIDEINNLKGKWEFRKTITKKMEDIHNLLKTDKNHRNDYGFYVLQKDGGEIVGLSEVRKSFPDLRLEYIESENEGKYKYIGQTMMASLGEVARREKLKRIYIPIPVESAVPFYKDKCGFREVKDSAALVMNINKTKRLTELAEEKTNAPIIDVRG
jgi:hypothetical protein